MRSNSPMIIWKGGIFVLKKWFGSLLLTSICLVSFSVNALATEIEMYEIPDIAVEEYQSVSQIVCGLSISGTTATCRSGATGLISVTEISVSQTLQKRKGDHFENVSSANWTTSVMDNYILFENTKSDLSNGIYRVKSVFKVKNGATTEEITSYSGEVTI